MTEPIKETIECSVVVPVSRQSAWQEKMRGQCRCVSCGKKDKRTKDGEDRCQKCLKKGREYSRNHKRRVLGCKAWKPGGRGRPPIK